MSISTILPNLPKLHLVKVHVAHRTMGPLYILYKTCIMHHRRKTYHPLRVSETEWRRLSDVFISLRSPSTASLLCAGVAIFSVLSSSPSSSVMSMVLLPPRRDTVAGGLLSCMAVGDSSVSVRRWKLFCVGVLGGSASSWLAVVPADRGGEERPAGASEEFFGVGSMSTSRAGSRLGDDFFDVDVEASAAAARSADASVVVSRRGVGAGSVGF